MHNDKYWMNIALEEANLAMKENEIPVGAVLVQNQNLIARGHNQPISSNDPTAHAEIQVLRKAGEKQSNYRLVNTTLYVTLEPCLMCVGAIIHARIGKVVFGAYNSKNSDYSLVNSLIKDKYFNHQIEIKGGVLENECQNFLQLFFLSRRDSCS